MNGRVTLQPTTTKSSAELVTRVKAHEYLNAMMNAASNRARDWKRMASLSDMLCWIVLDSVVMVFVTVPTETWSTLLIGWEKRAWTYSSRITADTRRPVTRKQNMAKYVKQNFAMNRYTMYRLNLLTDALNCASVTVVPGIKYPLNSPTRFPNTMFIRGKGTPDAIADIKATVNTRRSFPVA